MKLSRYIDALGNWLAGRDRRTEWVGRKLYNDYIDSLHDDDKMMSLDWEYLDQSTRDEFVLFAKMLPVLRVALAKSEA